MELKRLINCKNFSQDIINVDYTANMENDLDLIAENREDYIKVLKEFYGDFEPLVKKAFDEMEKKAPEVTGDIMSKLWSPI